MKKITLLILLTSFVKLSEAKCGFHWSYYNYNQNIYGSFFSINSSIILPVNMNDSVNLHIQASGGWMGCDIENVYWLYNGNPVGISQSLTNNSSYIAHDTGTYVVHFHWQYIGGNSSVTFHLVLNNPTSVYENYLSTNLNIYPNPFKDKFSINFHNNAYKEINFSIRNMLGETVFRMPEKSSGTVFHKEFDSAILSRGVYILEVIADGERITRRIIKE